MQPSSADPGDSIARASMPSLGRAERPGDPGLHARGASINPANRFERLSLVQLPPGGGDDDLLLVHDEDSEPEHVPDGDAPRPARRVRTVVHRDRSRTIINPVASPDIGFRWTINPYRGCEHGCVYCYARPTHETFGLSCGTDFETRLFAKVDAPQLFRAELARPAWRPETIVLSGITDPYQPIERHLGITRELLLVAAEHAQPVSIVTKSALVVRDLDVLKRLATLGALRVAISLTTLDQDLAARMEPRANAPRERLRAMRELSSAGVPVVAMTAPIIPGLNDHEIPRLLAAAARNGASHAGYVLLRLPWQVKTLFRDWLERYEPLKRDKVLGLVRSARGGRLYDAGFGARMRGSGPMADQIAQTFRVFARRFGLDRPLTALNATGFCRPHAPSDETPGQLRLWAEPN